MIYLPSGSGEYGGQCHDVVFAIKYASYIDRIGLQKSYKNRKKTTFFLVFWGAWRGLVTPKSGPGMVLEISGHLLASCARFSRNFSAGWLEDGRKMGEVGAKLGASCDQDGPR